MSHREIWWIGQQCPGIKGWDCGPDNPEKVERPSWEGEWVADPSWAVPAIVTQGRGGWKQWCLLLGLSTYFLVAATFSALQRQELLLLFCRWHRQGCSGSRAGRVWLHLCLVSPLLAGLHVGQREAEDYPWKMFNLRPIMFSSSLTPQTMAADWYNLEKMALSSADVLWLYLLDLTDFIPGSCFIQHGDSGAVKTSLEAGKKPWKIAGNTCLEDKGLA